ncbi:Ornithine carbamoyltransferase chloroplastic [Bienertia sinuspersici]
MLRNCNVARVLSRIADCAKNDRSVVLRASYNMKILDRALEVKSLLKSGDKSFQPFKGKTMR